MVTIRNSSARLYSSPPNLAMRDARIQRPVSEARGYPRTRVEHFSVALRLAVDAKSGMTDSLKTATDEALQNLSALVETVNEAIGQRLNS